MSLVARPRVVVATDKFKGSMTAAQATAAIAEGIRAARSDTRITEVPVADGGDGTLDAAMAVGYALRSGRPAKPQGRGFPFAMKDEVAIVELAAVCGLAQLPSSEPAPLTAGTYALGEVITAAIEAGAHRIVIALGGSASTDGGAGMMQALGLSLADATGAEVPQGGAALEHLCHVDASRLDARLSSIEFVLACDVDNPLLGPNGAAAVYGPQKGASSDDVATLERGLQRWARITSKATRKDVDAMRGAGAAGGTAFAALAYLGAEMRSGADLVLEMLSFDQVLHGATLVVTGEGALDAQTLHGKAPSAVQRAAAAQDVPVVAVTGRSELTAAETRELGFARVFELRAYEPNVDRAMRDAASLLRRTGAAVARTMLSSPGRVTSHGNMTSEPQQ